MLSVFLSASAAVSGSYLPRTAFAEDVFAFAPFVRALVRAVDAFADVVRAADFAPQPRVPCALLTFAALVADVRDELFAPHAFAPHDFTLLTLREVLSVAVAMNFTSVICIIACIRFRYTRQCV